MKTKWLLIVMALSAITTAQGQIFLDGEPADAAKQNHVRQAILHGAPMNQIMQFGPYNLKREPLLEVMQNKTEAELRQMMQKMVDDPRRSQIGIPLQILAIKDQMFMLFYGMFRERLRIFKS